MKKKDPVEVKISLLRVIDKAARPLEHRLDSLLSDYYRGDMQMSNAELAVLLEFRSAISTMNMMMEEYFEDAERHKVQVLHLPRLEFQALISFSRTAELAFRTPVCNTGLWTN
tara:strand:+ start:445 stop:783 length:339 start_codon:yes stop_codon:yes gene_type:complete